ncbi:magnesium-chelatase subunit D, partial [mine drainage metagenome]
GPASPAPGESEAVVVEDAVPVGANPDPSRASPSARHRSPQPNRLQGPSGPLRRGESRGAHHRPGSGRDSKSSRPHQLQRRQAAPTSEPHRLQLEKRDLRQKIRQRRIGNLIVFLVDASASMDAEQRMDATRSAILALLKDAYVRRDRVAM